MSTSIRVLILEDQPDDAELMVRELRRAGFELDWRRVESEQDYLENLEPLELSLDIILADYNLPQFNALRALRLLQACGLDIPFIVVTGAIGDELAAECIKQGASDYLLKDRLARLGSAVTKALEQKKLRDEKGRSEQLLRESENRFRALIENSMDAISLISADGTVLYASPAAIRILGYSIDELVGRSAFKQIHPDDLQYAMNLFSQLLQKPGGTKIGQVRCRHKDGSWRWIEAIGTNLLAEPAVQAIVANYRDITERKEAEETIAYLAYHDALTNFPNRRLFKDRMTLELARAKRNKEMVAVIFFDLDHFKDINDSLGHEIGDRFLKIVAERLTKVLREGDAIARLGGDEFALISTGANEIEGAAKIARKIMETLKQPWLVSGREFQVTTSIGIAIFPNDSQDAETLLRYADIAMYRAKKEGRNTYRFYNPVMSAEILERLELEDSLRQALRRGEFALYYQPRVSINTRNIVDMEALIRWQHPDRGLIYPSEFIPLAEEMGLILPIEKWVLRTACEQNRTWQKRGLPPLKVAVNLSSRQFRQQNLVETIAQVLKETGLEGRWLELEITEGIAMENMDYTIEILQKLREIGVETLIDDFGIGYCSLNYLKRLPISALKIDRAFVRDIAEDPRDAAIIEMIIVLAKNLGLNVIAEGVETENQYLFLKERDCDQAQGYLFSKPMPIEESESYLKLMADG